MPRTPESVVIKNEMVHVTARCEMCGKTNETVVPIPAFRTWMAGTPIQEAWPEGTMAEREQLMTGYDDACFKKLTREF